MQAGQRIRGLAGTILWLSNDSPKYGIITSKKLGSAIVRNRIRRRIREALKAIEIGVIKAKSIVIIPNRAAKDIKFSILKGKLEEMLRMA